MHADVTWRPPVVVRRGMENRSEGPAVTEKARSPTVDKHAQPVEIESAWGTHMSGAKRRRKICRASPLFRSGLQVQLVVFVSAFVMVTGQYSLVSFLFAVSLLTVSPCPMDSASVCAKDDQ